VSAAPRHVVIAGGGSIAWIAAAALRRTLKNTGLEVTVVYTPESGAPPARWTLPSQRGAHAQIGLSEPDFLRQAEATYRLGTEFLGWQGDGSRYAHAHGEIGSPIDVTPFYKWLLAQGLQGKGDIPDRYSVGGAAARMGRFARPMGAGNELTASFTYGYHLDENAYVRLLRALAEKAGVRRVAGRISAVNQRADGAIESLTLDSGTTVAGDLFLDCTGASAELISRLDSGPRIDWKHWLPCDRILTTLLPASAAPPAITGVMAIEGGWMFKAPLANANYAGHVYSSAHVSDDAALATLLRLAGPSSGAAPAAVPVVTGFESGRRSRFWVRNCIALGTSAVQIEPLAGADLHLAQLGLATLLELFPLDQRIVGEDVEFNRIVGEYADSLRDYTHAHYHLSRRAGAFWDLARAAPPSETLAAKLDLFTASGRIDIRDHEVFEEIDWAWLLMGAGLKPRALEWQISRVVSQVRPEQIAELRGYVERIVGSMPRHIDYLQHVKTAPMRVPGAGA
jgi:tryptophan 7-halogenase